MAKLNNPDGTITKAASIRKFLKPKDKNGQSYQNTVAAVNAVIKEREEREEKEKRATNFWREYLTQCANCGKQGKHKSGFLFVGMAPSGEMKTFCNVDCCSEWEQKDDNTNSRREAIKAQKARKT